MVAAWQAGTDLTFCVEIDDTIKRANQLLGWQIAEKCRKALSMLKAVERHFSC